VQLIVRIMGDVWVGDGLESYRSLARVHKNLYITNGRSYQVPYRLVEYPRQTRRYDRYLIRNEAQLSLKSQQAEQDLHQARFVPPRLRTSLHFEYLTKQLISCSYAIRKIRSELDLLPRLCLAHGDTGIACCWW
jgi:hypothetical protein